MAAATAAMLRAPHKASSIILIILFCFALLSSPFPSLFFTSIYIFLFPLTSPFLTFFPNLKLGKKNIKKKIRGGEG